MLYKMHIPIYGYNTYTQLIIIWLLVEIGCFSWPSAQQLMSRKNFFQDMEFYDKTHLSAKLFNTLSQLVNLKDFQPGIPPPFLSDSPTTSPVSNYLTHYLSPPSLTSYPLTVSIPNFTPSYITTSYSLSLHSPLHTQMHYYVISHRIPLCPTHCLSFSLHLCLISYPLLIACACFLRYPM